MNIYDFTKWWWDNNIEWIRNHDPYIIPLIAFAIPLSFVIRTVYNIMRIWRGTKKL